MKSKPARTTEELAIFCGQLAELLRAGILLSDGLQLLCEENPQDAALKTAAEQAAAGAGLSEALRAAGGFPEQLTGMVEVGERSGQLESVLTSLERFYQREQAIRRQMQSALLYPLLLLVMMLVVIAVLLLKVLPIFSDVFRLLGAAPAAEGMLGVGRAVGIGALLLTALAASAALTVFVMCRTARGYERLCALLARLPLSGKLSEKLSAGRFAFGLSLLLSSGYDIDSAMDSLSSIITHPGALKKLGLCRQAMAQGKSFSAALEECRIFSPLCSRMLKLGERAGTLEESAKKVAALYDDELEESLSGVLGAIEPAIALLLALVVGAVLLCVVLPLLSVMTAMG